LDWRAKVGLFEQIRREYEFGIGTIAGVAKKPGVHRRMVREAIGSALPRPRKKAERPRWKVRAAVDFVDAVLEADRKAPRKQRHTAHRIWQRIQYELPGLHDRRTHGPPVRSDTGFWGVCLPQIPSEEDTAGT
jgi:tryptophan 2,3-dioxygenase